MRITIEIEGSELVTTGVHPSVTTTVAHPASTAPAAASGPTAPPELVAAAAALGAVDAGPAPAKFTAAGATMIPLPPAGEEIVGAGLSATDAGAAPGATLEAALPEEEQAGFQPPPTEVS